MSDLENLNIIIGSSHFDKGENDMDDLRGRHDSQSFANSVEPNSHSNSNSRDNDSRGFAVYGQSTSETDPNVNLNHLTGVVHHRITQGMNGLIDNLKFSFKGQKMRQSMNTFCISYKLQASLKANFPNKRSLNGQATQRKGNMWSKRTGRNPELSLDRN